VDDTFMEKIVAHKKTSRDYLTILGVSLAGFVVLFLILSFGTYVAVLLPILLVGVGYGMWYLLSGLNREYEYIVTNGDLDIDVIIARRRRKRVFSGKSKDFELMAKVDSDDFREASKGQFKLLDCSSTIQAKENWFILAPYKGQRTLVVFAPDERMLKSLKRFNPSRIKYVIIGV
jgi:hypothetical protein